MALVSSKRGCHFRVKGAALADSERLKEVQAEVGLFTAADSGPGTDGVALEKGVHGEHHEGAEKSDILHMLVQQ